MKTNLLTILLLLLSTTAFSQTYVKIESHGDLTCYYPQFSKIDIVTGKMPEKSEKDVIFVCAGAFTGELLTEFKHSNIAGHHVCSGTFYEGFKGLKALGVKTALYCDMGTGWNYSWYRADDDSVKELFTVKGKYATNWIVFYK